MSKTIRHFEKVRALAANAQVLVVGGVRTAAVSQITVFDHRAAKVLGTIDVPSHVFGLALTKQLILAACADGHVRAFDLASRASAFDIVAHSGGCTAITLTPGNRFATVGWDGSARLWDERGAKVSEWQLSGQVLRAVSVDVAGEYLGTGGDDGVVRVITLATGERRDMPGHAGMVTAVAFTPRDGRIASAGEDGTLRFWYLGGSIEFEKRNAEADVLALAFAPTPAPSEEDPEPQDRVYLAGVDGKVRVFRVEEKRKPRVIDVGSDPLYALAFTPAAKGQRDVLGALFSGGDARTIGQIEIDATGKPGSRVERYDDGFAALKDELKGNKPRKEKAVAALAPLDEPEALDILLATLKNDSEADVRALVATELGNRQRTAAKGALRDRLDDQHPAVRREAFTAQVKLDPPGSLAPLRAALASKFPEIRYQGLVALPPLRASSPLVPGLIADRLTDPHAPLRLHAVATLLQIYPKGSDEPLRTAYLRGPSDVKIEVLARALREGQLSSEGLSPLIGQALDDTDASVRRAAFAAKVLERRSLTAQLEPKDTDLANAIQDLLRRIAQLSRAKWSDEAPTKEEIAAARKALPSIGSESTALTEADLDPLLTAMACRAPDTALRGGRGLAQVGDLRALGALLQLSREADAALRRQAAAALQELHDPRAKGRLVAMLEDTDGGVRGSALDAYARFETSAPMTLAETALRSTHEDIRVRGLDLLMKQKAEKAAPPIEAEILLGDALGDEAAKVRAEAFRTLWSWHTSDPQVAIDQAMEARFPDLRLRAVEELVNLSKEEWTLPRLRKAIADRDLRVAEAAYNAVVKLRGKKEAEAHLAGLASIHGELRAKAAKESVEAPADELRSALIKQLLDEHPPARIAALETIDKLFKDDSGPLIAALSSQFLDMRVRAANLLAARRDEIIIEPMRSLLADKELWRLYDADFVRAIRFHAAAALASLGSPRLTKYFATELLKEEDPLIRQEGARGLVASARRGDEGFLLDALGNADVRVRSWAADGLCRLGDVRGLPVLTTNLRQPDIAIRLSAVISFAGLGPEGTGGLIQALEDTSSELQQVVFAILLARDLQAFRRGEPPELLTSALSSQRPEVRFAAARALELRTDWETYAGYVVQMLLPARPEKASDMKDWPPEELRPQLMAGLAAALAGSQPEQRYAAALTLLFRSKPIRYFQEAQRAGTLRSLAKPWIPETLPQGLYRDEELKPEKSWLRRLFSGDSPSAPKAPAAPTTAEQNLLRRLAFGAYMGLLRQITGDEESHRVRRDSVDRVVELGLQFIGVPAAIPPVVRALDDPNHLVRRAAFQGLKKLLAPDVDAPLSLALGSTSADVGKLALDEWAERGVSAKPRIVAALNARLPEVRKYAFDVLEKLSGEGSFEPLLAALASDFSDLRLGVIERLASSDDPRVVAALTKALESDHDDLRLRSAELLAQRRQDLSTSVLGTFLRSENESQRERALEALTSLTSIEAVRTLGTRLEDADEALTTKVVEALGATRNPEAIDVLTGLFTKESEDLRSAAFAAAMNIVGDDRKKRQDDVALRLFRKAVVAKDPALRKAASDELDAVKNPEANDLLLPLFSDRNAEVRVAAVTAYSKRVIDQGAPVAPLQEVLKAGARDLMLPAAEGVAARGSVEALRPLVLFVRAGEEGQRERALLALGVLGDVRALEELETVQSGGTEEAPVEESMREAATEALGRLHDRLTEASVRTRVFERLEGALEASNGLQTAAIRGLRWIPEEKARLRIERFLANNDNNDTVRTEAAKALGDLKNEESEKVLGKAFDTYDSDLSQAIYEALMKLFLKDRTRVEFWAVEANDSDIAGRAALYLATQGDAGQVLARLGKIEDDDIRGRLSYGLLRRAALPGADLAKLLQSDSPEVRSEVAWLLGARMGDGTDSIQDRAAVTSAIAAALAKSLERWQKADGDQREKEATAWQRLLWAAGSAKADGVELVAQNVLTRPELPEGVRQEAARTLLKLGTQASVATLTTALADQSLEVRRIAAAALTRLMKGDASAKALTIRPFDPVVFGITTSGPVTTSLVGTDEGRRLVLPSALARKDVAALVELARTSADENTKFDAFAALGQAGAPDAQAYLKSVSTDNKSGSVNIRKAAYRAYRRGQRVLARTQKESR